MVLVVGATGRLGLRIARRLLAEEHPVRALVRPGSAYQALEAAGAEIMVGDLKQPSALARACRGMAAVVSAGTAVTEDEMEGAEIAGNRVLIEAARDENIEQLVFLSALGAASDSPVPLLRAKARAEEALLESDLSFTIIEPDFLMDAWLTALVLKPARAGRPVSVPGSGLTRRTFVAADDVAALTVAAIGHPLAAKRILPFGGPEAVSLLDVVERCATILGRVIPVRHVPPGQPVPGLSEAASLLAATLDTEESLLDSAELADAFGITLTPLDTWLRGQVADAT